MSEEKKPVPLTQHQRDIIASALLYMKRLNQRGEGLIWTPQEQAEAKAIVDLMAEEN